MSIKIEINIKKSSFAYDKCVINNREAKNITIIVNNLHSLLYDTLPIHFVKTTLLTETKICSASIRFRRFIEGKLVCVNLYEGADVYDNYMRAIYGTVWFDIRVELVSVEALLKSNQNKTREAKEYIRSNKAEHKAENYKSQNQNPQLNKAVNCQKKTENENDYFVFQNTERGCKNIPLTQDILDYLHRIKFVEVFYENKNTIFNKMFEALFDIETAKMYNSTITQIYRLYKYMSKGSYTCIIKFWFGLIILESYYKNVKKSKKETIDRSKTNGLCHNITTCDVKEICTTEKLNLCHKTINDNQCRRKFHLYLIDIYYYAISSYANSLLTLLVKRRRKLANSTVKNSVLSFIDIDERDLLIINLSSNIDVQFIAFFDVKEKELVVSFRGTQTLLDAINDLDCEYQMFYDGYAHRGFVKLAELFISNHLKKIKELLQIKQTTRLLLTGQSLGGAISHIVNIITDSDNLIPDVDIRVISFQSPPVVSQNLVCQKNAQTIIYGYDIVPRLSFGSLLDLKYLSISIANFMNTFSKTDKSEYIKKVIKHLKDNEINPKLYLPGQIYQIWDNDKVTVEQINCEDPDNIIVHKKCFWDHGFNEMLNALEKGSKGSKDP